MAKIKGRIVDRNRLSKKYSYVRAPKRLTYLGDRDLQIEVMIVAFNNESSKEVKFEFPFPTGNYSVSLTPRQTVPSTADSAAVNLYVTTCTASHLTINATAPFTGEVDVLVIEVR